MFNLKEELQERFFTVHPSSIQFYKMFSFDMLLYDQLMKTEKKIRTQMQRKRKMKNMMYVFKTKFVPLQESKKKMVVRFKKYMQIYISLIKRYGKEEIKESLLAQANVILEGYKKKLDTDKKENVL